MVTRGCKTLKYSKKKCKKLKEWMNELMNACPYASYDLCVLNRVEFILYIILLQFSVNINNIFRLFLILLQ